jgi:hypothetical protein
MFLCNEYIYDVLDYIKRNITTPCDIVLMCHPDDGKIGDINDMENGKIV